MFTAKCNAPGISTPHTGMDTLRTDCANHSNTAHDRSSAAAAHMNGTLKTDQCWRRITLGTPPSGSTWPMRAAKDLTTRLPVSPLGADHHVATLRVLASNACRNGNRRLELLIPVRLMVSDVSSSIMVLRAVCSSSDSVARLKNLLCASPLTGVGGANSVTPAALRAPEVAGTVASTPLSSMLS